MTTNYADFISHQAKIGAFEPVKEQEAPVAEVEVPAVEPAAVAEPSDNPYAAFISKQAKSGQF